MATADQYAEWIVNNAAKRGTPEFDTVAQAYQLAKQEEARAIAPVVQPSKERSTGEAFSDVGAQLKKGAAQLVQFPGQLYGLTTGDFSETGLYGYGKEMEAAAEAAKSPGLKAREAARAAAVAEAEKKGQLSAAKTAIGQTITDPALALGLLAENLPGMLVPAGAAVGVGRAALQKGLAKGVEAAAAREAAVQAGTRAAVGTGAAQQGADVGTGAYEDVYKRLVSQGVSEPEAAAKAINLARAAGVSGAIISILAQRLPGASKLEEVLAGKTTTAGLGRAVLGGALREPVGEIPEEVGGRFTQNLALRTVDPTQSLTAGLGETGAMAGLAAAGMGGLGGGISSVRGRRAPEEVAKPEAGAQPAEAEAPKPVTGEAGIVRPEEEVKPLTSEEQRELDMQQRLYRSQQPKAEELLGEVRGAIQTAPPTTPADIARIRDDHETAVINSLLEQDRKMQSVADLARLNVERASQTESMEAATQDADRRVREGRLMGRVQSLIDLNIPFASTAIADINRKFEMIGEAPLDDSERSRVQNIMTMAQGFTDFVKLPSLPAREQDIFAENQAMQELESSYKEQLQKRLQQEADRQAQLSNKKKQATTQAVLQSIQKRGGIASIDEAEYLQSQGIEGAFADVDPGLGETISVTSKGMEEEISPEEMSYRLAQLKERKPRGQVSPQPVRTEAPAPSPVVGQAPVSGRVEEGAAIRPTVSPEPGIAEDRQRAEPVAPAANPVTPPIQSEQQAKQQHAVQGLGIVEIPVNEVQLSEDVPQFKSDADQAGVVERLEGKFERTGVAPIQVWRRRNGRLEVISGRHRLDLAQRTGEATIPAQIHDEASGFDTTKAATLDAELNIRDGQGKVKDYVVYFEKSGITEDEAKSRGLLGRALGKRAWAIASKGSEELIAAHRGNVIDDAAAEAIASAAPGDSRLQAVGIKATQDGKNTANAVNMIQAVRAMTQDRVTDTTFDMFGFDDSAIKEAENMAKAATQKQAEIDNRLRAISGAAKRPDIAKKEGVDVRDPNALKTRIEELKKERAAWDNWATNPDLVAEVRQSLQPTTEEGEGKKSLRAGKAQQLSDFEQTLRTALNRFGLKDIGLKLINGMTAEGSYAQKLIQIAADSANPVRTLRHEAIHALRELGFFTPQQWQSLSKMAKYKWIDQYLKQRNIDGKPLKSGEESRYDAYMREYNGDMEKITEEAVADAFADFDATKPPSGLMQALLARLRNLFQSIKSALTKVESPEKIFGKVERGELKAGAPVKQGEAKSLRDRATANFLRWFGDSKVVDEKGEPLVVYHGTSEEFNVFDPDRLGSFTGAPSAKEGFFFGSSRANSEEYVRNKGFDSAIKAILNELRKSKLSTTARVFDANGDLIRQRLIAPNVADVKKLVDNGYSILDAFVKSTEDLIAKVYDEAEYNEQNDKARLSAIKSIQNVVKTIKNNDNIADSIKFGKVMDVYLKIENPYIRDDQGQRRASFADDIKIAKKLGHDGVIFRNTKDPLPTDVFVVFSPTQIKSAIGNNGEYSLTDADIRKSLRKPGEPAPTAAGQQALDTINQLGMGVKKPEKGTLEKAKAKLQQIGEAPAKDTIKDWKKKVTGLMDYVDGKLFSADAPFENKLREGYRRDMKDMKEFIGAQLAISQSQAVNADAVSTRSMLIGKPKFRKDLLKWEAVEDPANEIAKAEILDKIAEKYGLTKEEAVQVAHTYLAAANYESILKRNAANKNKADRLRDAGKDEEADKAKAAMVFVTPEQAAMVQPGLEIANQIPEVKEITALWNQQRENVKDVLLETGLWTPEYADAMMDNAAYVPFYREMEEDSDDNPEIMIRGLQVKAKEHKLKGSSKPVENVFENMARWQQYAINRAIRNHKALQMVDAATEMPFGDGMMATKVSEAKRGKNITRVWRDGKQEFYEMADPLFVDAFKSLGAVSIPSVKYFTAIANKLRQFIVLYPMFSVAQLSQDSVAAMFSSGLQPKFALKIPYLAVKHAISTFRGTNNLHNELINFGVVGVRDFNAAVSRDDAAITAGIKMPPGGVAKVKYVLERIAMSADNAVRQAVYEAAMQQPGVTQAEALEKAFEVINFRRRGSSKLVNLIGQTVPFFYAYLSAQRVAYKTITGVGISPVERKAAIETLIYTSAAVMALSFIYAMANGDDEAYEKTPTNIRDRSINIPGTNGFRIPLRPDFFLFPKIIAEHTYHLIAENGFSDPAKFKKAMADNFFNATLSPNVVPQAFKPAVEIGLNYDFFSGKPIVGFFEQNKEAGRQFSDSTSEFAKMMGGAGLSPQKVDHFIRGYFGTVGGLFLYGTNFFIEGESGVPRPELSFEDAIKTFPGVSALKQKPTENALKVDFYELRDAIEKAKNTYDDIKKRSPEGLQDFIENEENYAKLALEKSVTKIADHLSDIRRTIQQISAAPEDRFSAAEKQERIKELKEVELQLLKSVNLKEMRAMAKM